MDGQTMPHRISSEDLSRALQEVSEIQVAGHFGKGYRVSVKYNAVEQVWKVYDHGELVGTALGPDAAADMYNAVRPRSEVSR